MWKGRRERKRWRESEGGMKWREEWSGRMTMQHWVDKMTGGDGIVCMHVCVCVLLGQLYKSMAQNQKPSIQTCWHVLSISFFLSLPLYSSPLFNPPLLEDRLVNPWLVSVNAANSRLRLRELATPVCVCADLLCLKPFFSLCLNFSTLELSMASLSVALTTIGVDSSFSSRQDLLVFHTCSFLSPLVDRKTDLPPGHATHAAQLHLRPWLTPLTHALAHTDIL